ncbi:MAG: DUF1836 domain-containing protein [Eubacterium sp.]|nr:DUF1836 domain-containing protein [Eubacterium sp.]MDY5497527.1 DUF1836 domain-containing protein [Anaerobutyricum sp.]
MKQDRKEKLKESIETFHLPRYDEIPDVGLYLEQVAKYIGNLLMPLEDISITRSMISNYIKQGLVSNPVKKQYNRDQIAYLIFIAIAKSVLSLEHIRLMIDMQKDNYDNATAYNYFCMEFENVLFYVFGFKDNPEQIGTDSTDLKLMLQNLIVTSAHKIYLDKCFNMIGEQL